MKFSNAVCCVLGGALCVKAQVDLGTAASFGALAPAGVTNTGDTVINGDVGTTGTSVTGFPPGIYTGSLYIGDGVAAQAQADSTAAFNQGQGLSPTQDFGALTELGGLVLTPGVYSFDSAVDLTGLLTLSGAGTYVFQIGSSLTTAGASLVLLTNGVNACDVYFIVISAATLSTMSNFSGNILAGTGITLNIGASVAGGLYAGSAITLNDNTVSSCGGPTSPTSSSQTVSATSATSASTSDSVSVTTPASSSSSTAIPTTASSPTKSSTQTTTAKSTTKATTSSKSTLTTVVTTSKKTTTTQKNTPSAYPTTTTKKVTTTTKKATTTTRQTTVAPPPYPTTTTSKKVTTTAKMTTPTTTSKYASTTTSKKVSFTTSSKKVSSPTTSKKATTTTKAPTPSPYK